MSDYDPPPVPLERLQEQSLKNRDYALALVERLPADQAGVLRAELDALTREMTAAYEAGDAVEHYRLDRQLFFQFLLKLDFALQAEANARRRG